jgi:hypothetical protein
MDPITHFRELRTALESGDDRTATAKAEAILAWFYQAGVVPDGMTPAELFGRIVAAGFCPAAQLPCELS